MLIGTNLECSFCGGSNVTKVVFKKNKVIICKCGQVIIDGGDLDVKVVSCCDLQDGRIESTA